MHVSFFFFYNFKFSLFSHINHWFKELCLLKIVFTKLNFFIIWMYIIKQRKIKVLGLYATFITYDKWLIKNLFVSIRKQKKHI